MTSRSRLVWANVWEVLSRHFAAVGLHENVSVAMFSIDSLRQLSIKFLYKEELRWVTTSTTATLPPHQATGETGECCIPQITA